MTASLHWPPGTTQHCSSARWLRGRRICLQCGRPGSSPWVRKVPWRREGLLIPAFSPRKPHGQRSLAGYSPCDCEESDTATNKACSNRKQIFKKKLYQGPSSCSWSSLSFCMLDSSSLHLSRKDNSQERQPDPLGLQLRTGRQAV